MSVQGVQRSIFVVLAMGGVSTVALLFYESDRSLPVLLFAVWCILPYLVLWFMAVKVIGGMRSALAVGITAILILAYGVAGYYYAFFAHLDAQSGITFLTIPQNQLCAAGGLFAAIVIVRAVSTSRVTRRNA